ncbi:putative clathrin assembly protein [Hibiscus syriacus]|uniref:Clathrin assembly protein n=1 Tax=Hibiscus syriacus TaxID=106335 RepID=A0A6A3AQP6_HIBSY|nr:putative clathrin assembly protein At1g03050 [Hibiscus syriacus]KAE8706238.1 putative clathrin assembly protein [Hibiscus syriacus]
MASKLKRAIGRVKDQTSIGLAKVGGSTLLSDLDVAIVKATRHEEYPADERHIREILSLTSSSRAYVSACVNSLSRRLNKTKNWTVALKTLVLIHRLLAEGDPAYEQEIFFSTRRGTRILNMSDFRDTSRSNSWDFSAFVRTYALYLDESLEFKMQGKNAKRNMYKYDEEFGEENNDKAVVIRSTPVHELKTEQLFQRMQQLQQILERFLACRPTGEAKCNRVVTVALYPILKESFQIYYDMAETMGALIDRFMDVDMSDTMKIYDIFCRQSQQFDELDAFYSWCRTFGVARPSEFPEIEKITQKKLDLLDELIRDKLALEQGNTSKEEPMEVHEEIKETEPEEDINAVKALPPPENLFEEELEKKDDDDNSKAIIVQLEADLLNLGEEAISSEDHANKLALALFDGLAPAVPLPGPRWEDLIKDETDWEIALVQSVSSLNNRKAELGGGFDKLLLDGMYQKGQTMAAMQSCAATGSASSVAFGSAGRPAMLALPAPPSSNGCDKNNNGSMQVDPFAASLSVAPPPYVQMSDMEKKQKLLVEEQVMWEQYRRNGMQGHVGLSKVETYPYNQGGWYTHGY